MVALQPRRNRWWLYALVLSATWCAEPRLDHAAPSPFDQANNSHRPRAALGDGEATEAQLPNPHGA
eukprot:1848312-Alexandrium_andersonii.AAC.1